MMRILVGLSLLVLCSGVGAEETAAVIETFKPPEAKSRSAPKYPKSAQHRSQEGWVTLSYMVDTAGKPYDITVVRSSGIEAFEKAAVKAAKRWRYEPAELNGRKIDAGTAVSITFGLSGRTGASGLFVRKQRRLHKAIEAGDKAEADKYLAELRSRERNLYEEAYLNLSLYHYYGAWGSPEQQLTALHRTTFVDGPTSFLPKATLRSANMRKFALQLQMFHLADARQTGESLLEMGLDEEQEAEVRKLLLEIEEAVASPAPIRSDGSIDEAYRFSRRLARRSFAFEGIDGDIAELRLHCDKAYLGMAYEEDMSYTIPEGQERCHLTAIGTPGTTFNLIELAD